MMLLELSARSKEWIKKINASKTKVIQSSSMPKGKSRVDGIDLEEVDSYVYLGQRMKVHHNLQRITAHRSL